MKAICYCHDDRKMSNTQVFQVPKSAFKVTKGQPKVYTKVSDHGNVSLSISSNGLEQWLLKLSTIRGFPTTFAERVVQHCIGVVVQKGIVIR